MNLPALKKMRGESIRKCLRNSEKTLLFAVASRGGILVDQHFGHVSDFYIYEYKTGAAKFRERRGVPKYCGGPEDCGGTGNGMADGASNGAGNAGGKTAGGMFDKEEKMEKIFKTIEDCSCVIAMRAGDAPRKKLAEKGIRFLSYYGRIEEAVKEAAAAILKEMEIEKENEVKEAIS